MTPKCFAVALLLMFIGMWLETMNIDKIWKNVYFILSVPAALILAAIGFMEIFS